MIARTLAVLSLVLIAAPAFAADKDREALQGTWKIEKATRGGMEMPAEMRDKVTLEFKGDEAIVHEPGKDEPATYTLDATKSPKTINIKPKKDEKQVQGIYELSGDTLKICFAREGGERPSKFESPEGSNLMLMEMKRVKK